MFSENESCGKKIFLLDILDLGWEKPLKKQMIEPECNEVIVDFEKTKDSSQPSEYL